MDYLHEIGWRNGSNGKHIQTKQASSAQSQTKHQIYQRGKGKPIADQTRPDASSNRRKLKQTPRDPKTIKTRKRSVNIMQIMVEKCNAAGISATPWSTF
jgi:hypothetical protein